MLFDEVGTRVQLQPDLRRKRSDGDVWRVPLSVHFKRVAVVRRCIIRVEQALFDGLVRIADQLANAIRTERRRLLRVGGRLRVKDKYTLRPCRDTRDRLPPIPLWRWDCVSAKENISAHGSSLRCKQHLAELPQKDRERLHRAGDSNESI